MNIYNPVQHFDANTVGRDFVCGDLHGCVEDLMEALAVLNFDTSCDRLFSVGDLVDRGPKSFETAELIYQKFFFSVKGNHEQMLIDSILFDNSHQLMTWMNNGGEWFTNHEEWKLKSLAEDLNQLPIIITVGEGENRFNVVHAELTKGAVYNRIAVSDADIDNWTFDTNEEFNLLWGRSMVRDRGLKSPLAPENRFHSEQLSPTYVGHTPLAENVQIEKQIYLDLGAVFNYAKPIIATSSITFAEPNRKLLYRFSTASKEMQTYTLDSITKFHQ